MKNLKTLFHKKNKIKLIFSVCLILLAVVSIVSAKASPFVAEYVFARGIFKVLSVPVGFVTGLLPFSIIELAIPTFAVFFIVAALVFFIKLKKKTIIKQLIGGLLNVLLTVSVIGFLFCIFCGVNYYRYDFSKFAGLNVREYTVDELYELCVYLAKETSNARSHIDSTDKNGVMVLGESFYDTSSRAGEAMRALSKQYKSVNYMTGRAKPIIISKYFSYTGITGIYSPFTIEANVNNHMPDYNKPVTICHELAHLAGYMKEDEANYIAYLACINSDDYEFKYSGYALAYTYASNRLYDADIEKFYEVAELISEDVYKDFADDIEYWDSYEDTEIGETIGDVSNEINDTYLNLNGQEEGTKSYGMMVDLLLADYLSHKE